MATITGETLNYFKMERTTATGADLKKMRVMVVRDAEGNFITGYWKRDGVLDKIISTIEDDEIFEIRDIDSDGIENCTLTEMIDKNGVSVIVK